ncbi:hypothetical protein CPC08DRAFT_630060 [Agrocybe pediades]|nr:hypothetical protein CPC08DRAFT_630060 [Agrocybe pediades]
MARVGITNHFLNTVITAFQAPDWEALLERIGEDAMLHLLMDTSIFIPLPNGCLCQLTGEPALFLAPSLNNALRDSAGVKQTKRPHKVTESVDVDDERPKKRRKLEKTASSIFLEKSIEKRRHAT